MARVVIFAKTADIAVVHRMRINMKKIITEGTNKKTKNIDIVSTLKLVEMINNEDKYVAKAVVREKKKIAAAIDLIAEKFQKGGRLLYFGAGTSGRLGVLDASECPPTFGVDKSMVQGFIAGGDYALRNAIEGAEDSFELGAKDLLEANATQNDVVTAISASGNANYVITVLKNAKAKNIKTIAICCNKRAKMKEYADIFICPLVKEEVISGSTRMKCGTAQKMVLNLLTTGAMIKIGKTYQNYMIDVKATNEKLKNRAINIVCELANVTKEQATETLTLTNFEVKKAVVMLWFNTNLEIAEKLLKDNNGVLRKIKE